MDPVRKTFCLSIILIALTITGLSTLSAQESTQIAIDTDMVIVFPSLDCRDIEAPFAGSTWNDITVGSSTLNDLRSYVTELSSSYTETSFTSFQITSFSISNAIAEEESIPPVVSACINPNSEKVFAIRIINPFPRIHIQDLVADFGIPDLVLWDEILMDKSIRLLVKLAAHTFQSS